MLKPLFHSKSARVSNLEYALRCVFGFGTPNKLMCTMTGQTDVQAFGVNTGLTKSGQTLSLPSPSQPLHLTLQPGALCVTNKSTSTKF